MKKFIAVILALTLAASLAGCKGKNDTFKVDIFVNNLADVKSVEVLDLIKARLSEAGLAEEAFEIHDAGGDQTEQILQIKNACETGSSLLVVALVSPSSSSATYSIVQLAKNYLLPVLFYDREPTTTAAVDSYAGEAIYVGPSSEDAALAQAELIFNLLKDNYSRYDRNKDGHITYAQLVTAATTLESTGRLKVATEVNRLLKEAGLGELVYYDAKNTNLYYVCAHGLATEAARFTDEILEIAPLSGSHPIELIISTTDTMALGVIERLNELGYNKGAGSPMIPVFGIDATSDALAALNTGALSGTVRRDIETLAQRVAELIMLIKDGTAITDIPALYEVDNEEAPYYIRTPYVPVSSS